MAFPTSSLTNNQVHKEGNRAFVYDSALGVWDQVRETDRTETELATDSGGDIGTVTAGTFNSVIGPSATGFGLSTFAVQYYLNSAFTGGTALTNWTKYGGYTPNSKDMHESLAVWSFPTTGVWNIYLMLVSAATQIQNDYYEAGIRTTSNAGSSYQYHYAYNNLGSFSGGNQYIGSSIQLMFDVTNTSTHQVVLAVASQTSTFPTQGGFSATRCQFHRIGDI